MGYTEVECRQSMNVEMILTVKTFILPASISPGRASVIVKCCFTDKQVTDVVLILPPQLSWSMANTSKQLLFQIYRQVQLGSKSLSTDNVSMPWGRVGKNAAFTKSPLCSVTICITISNMIPLSRRNFFQGLIPLMRLDHVPLP